MADQNPLAPFASRLGRLIGSLRDTALRLLKVESMELTNLSRIAGDEIEALRTSLDRACVTIPDGRRLLATEHAALMTFARANGITEKMLWDRITIRHHGRVTEGDFACCRVTDITALASCTKFEVLSLHVNEITE